MDYSEAVEVVYRRIGELINPENAGKVLGYILLQNEGIPEMFRLANAPTRVLKTLVDEVEQKLCSSLKSSHSSLVPFSSPSQNLQHFPSASSPLEHNLHNVFSLEEKLISSCNLNRPFHPSQETNTIPYLKPSSLANQVCDDFSRGYCRHGGDCKLLHLRLMENGTCIMILNPKTKDDTITPDHALQRASTLKHLEMELVELLRCRRNIPVSISSIPILYYDKYAMPLQVEGYLLNHRNKENFICTMKQLLAQMEKNICILNRLG